MDAQIMSAKALQRVFPTTVALSHASWLGSPGGNREPAGLIVVWQMCYPVQHVLDAAASMASSATFGGFCCGQYLAAITTTVAYGTGVGRTQLRNTAVKVNGRLPFKLCHFSRLGTLQQMAVSTALGRVGGKMAELLMKSAISSEGSMRTSRAALRNGCCANHDGYQ